jgi:hypothetical protein
MIIRIANCADTGFNGDYAPDGTQNSVTRYKLDATHYCYKGAGGAFNLGSSYADTNPTTYYTVSSALSYPPYTGWSPNAGAGNPGAPSSPSMTITHVAVNKYVTATASGSGDGSLANPWTLSQAMSGALGGDIINIQQGNYSAVTTTLTCSLNSSPSMPIIFRGYKTTPGDGYLGRNADGTLITTNFPTIPMTGSGRFTFSGSNVILECVEFTRSGTTTTSCLNLGTRIWFHRCKVTDSTTGSGASAITPGLNCIVSDCDLSLNGSSAGYVLNPGNSYTRVHGCRIQAANSYGMLMGSLYPVFSFCTFFNMVAALRITSTGASGITPTFIGCTAYGLTGPGLVEMPNNATQSPVTFPMFADCIITDNAKAAENLNSSTIDAPIALINNRTRDNTANMPGFAGWPDYGAVTTDGGNYSTDYTDAPGGNFKPVSTSPAVGAGTFSRDIGAQQATATSSVFVIEED